MVFGDDLIAGAVVANGCTKRKMHIQRQRFITLNAITMIKPLSVCLGIKTKMEAIGGWVGGVTRPWLIKPTDKRLVDAEAFNGSGHS
jgi:hypothetical protein